ncbi:hypothetical protein Fmac_027351 [Flemingia macrophylla]|uniref:CCD97-like C-terminal domain-containing protein n=1 Tax=Flemingia macrophylla TaxID=520843 RepID=A0ABD1LHH5_9FABA
MWGVSCNLGGLKIGGKIQGYEPAEQLQSASPAQSKAKTLFQRHGNENDGNPGRVIGEPTLSAEELEDRMNQFTYIMQQKFLLGEDGEHLDYTKIDNDESLDDHWQREANIDAEERYFADD